MDFIVNRELRKEIIKIKRKQLGGGAKLLYFTSKLFLTLAIMTLVAGGVMSIVLSTDWLEIMLFVGISAIVTTFVWVVSYVTNAILEKNHMYLWATRLHEELHLQKNALEYGCYTRHQSNEFCTWKIKYSEIKRLEYDSQNYCLKIYAPVTYKEWTDNSRVRCLESDYIEKVNNGEVYILIPAYFIDFEKFLREVEQKTGKDIVKCHINL